PSYLYPLSLHDALPILAFSLSVGLRLRQRTYSSSRISGGVFFSANRRPIRLPAAIFCVVASPLSRCSDCDSVGSSFTSHEHTVSDRKSTRLNSSHLGIS